ncbi:spore germination protein [Clostridium magnum]|uniref:Spore germination protein B1 n=1 Tax=Clostridium magnum DSM 2767 TaxID=1121326 RepID=A0A162TAJ9_9CLOT|nr:spore germination protein [Clostridium magnum]KZL92411.1 spore germination protein B1 [Clostridium magnum DSM 2767]SHH10396.1 spore germination protein KA [Clostridium magnum DSM 2767]
MDSNNISDSDYCGDQNTKISKSIDVIKNNLLYIFSDCSDFVYREIELKESEIRIVIAYTNGLVDNNIVNTDILRPLTVELKLSSLSSELSKNNIVNVLKKHLLSISELQETEDFRTSVQRILSGYVLLYIDGLEIAVTASAQAWASRSVGPPDTEAVVRGPREGFVETLRVNTSLLRRKIKNPNLKFEEIVLGEQTNTSICICYIKGIADEKIIETVRKRLTSIKTDAILESGYIEEFIEDHPFSVFPTIGNTEKPDIAAAKLLEGRVAILCDGTPFVLTVPFLFLEPLQSSEDYYSRSYFASLVRILRLIALLISIILPALYVALVAFHPDVIPLKLLLTMAASKEGIPFSPLIESLIMIISFEILREAGVRMPRPVGQALSIVGALVLGDAAVKSGLVSSPMVIVTALTAITSFITPPFGGTVPILRIFVLLVTNILGFMGLFLASIAIIIHLSSLRSFGVPYLSPLSPTNVSDLKDAFIRVPIWAMSMRPKSLMRRSSNKKRMKIDTRKKVD